MVPDDEHHLTFDRGTFILFLFSQFGVEAAPWYARSREVFERVFG
jgi:hypothetical protein